MFVGRCFSLLGWLVGAVVGKVQGAAISAIVERGVSMLGDSRLPPASLQCCGETVPAWGTLLGPSHLSTKHNTNLFPQTSVQVPLFISIRMRIPVRRPAVSRTLPCLAPRGIPHLAVSPLSLFVLPSSLAGSHPPKSYASGSYSVHHRLLVREGSG